MDDGKDYETAKSTDQTVTADANDQGDKGAGAADKEADDPEALKAKADEYLDKYRRSVAEFSNYRKRMAREQEQQSLRLRVNVLGSILPVLDDFRMATDAIPGEYAETSWVEGISLIERKLAKALESHNVTPMESIGQPFDPHLHEAFMGQESDEYPEGVVMEELRKGYMIGDQVLRPAMVKVSAGHTSSENVTN